MEFTPDDILDIANGLVVENNIKSKTPYEWVDTLGITQRPTDLERSLYFATHSDGTDGWHNPFDRRPSAAKVARDKGWDLAVEPGVDVGESQHMVVSSLTELSERLYEEARSKSNPYIVGVTGSVGKTTTIAFLEHLIKEAGFPVTRFWSKRLTPLLVQCHYVNRVQEDTPFVVMEYSAYEHSHVGDLSAMLPPNVAFLTNIYDTHINPGMFRDRQDIFDSKVRIKASDGCGFVNSAVLQDLGLPVPAGWRDFTVDQALSARNPLLPPTLRTAELHTAGRMLAEEIGIPFNTFRRAFETFVPQERRIISTEYKGSPIFFDGEATYGSRQWSWFETIDGSSSPTLLVDSINFGDEDPFGYKDLLTKIFDSDDTFVLDTPENRKILPVKATFVDGHKFRDLLEKRSKGYLVYHKAMATRDNDFDPKTYLKNRW